MILQLATSQEEDNRLGLVGVRGVGVPRKIGVVGFWGNVGLI